MLTLLSGGPIETNRIDDALCDELCAAHLRARAPSGGEGINDLEGRNSTGETPFLTACATGRVECMKLLSGAGCNTRAINNYGSNALICAAYSGVAAAVRAALAAGWCELEATSTDGSTAFLIACAKGHAKCMKLLAEAGCNTAATSDLSENALMLVARSGVEAAVRTALAAGWCDLEARDNNGDTAILVACYTGDVACMQLLANAGCNKAVINKYGENALMLSAAQSGVAAAVRAVLAAGWCELEARTEQGSTAFLSACYKGRVECMQVLVEGGCNTAAKNNAGLNNTNALMLAACSGVAAAVRAALVTGWCELEARSDDGSTAFLWACYKGNVECMQVLADAGCDTAVISHNGVNALMGAAQSGVAAAVRTALAAGWCELEARSTTTVRTAFLFACQTGKVGCMQLLAEAGCNTAANDICNRTATDIAKAGDNSVEAMQWLRQRDTANTVATLLQEGQELLASGRLSDAKTVAAKACSVLSSLPGSPELYSTCIELRDATQAALTKDLEERERRARVAEAELLAMLDAESTVTNRSEEQTQKAQRKKEKRRKQQQAKREAAARRGEALADPVSEQLPEQEPAPEQATEAEPVVQAEPEPDEQSVPLSPAVSAPESPCAEAESDGALTSVHTAPDEFCCPITSECMRDPVMVTATGMTYEREAIAEWLCEHDIDPSTGIKLGENKQLMPNVALRKMIDAWSHGCLLVYSRD